MIQKINVTKDAIQARGCGHASCDAKTVTDDPMTFPSQVQFLDRVDDVPVVLPLNAQSDTSSKHWFSWAHNPRESELTTLRGRSGLSSIHRDCQRISHA